jgi:hydroxymethylbilane synthase
MTDVIRIGTRGSQLARWQADHVAGLLRAAYLDLRVEIVVIRTRGDAVLDTPLPLIGGKGLFTAELEAALRGGEIDLAVHSLKDLPTDDPDGLAIGAVPERAPVNDVLVSRGRTVFSQLPIGAKVGTSSRRRAAQLLARRPDLTMADIRGNVPTRIQKVLDGAYDATVLAQAGLERLGRADTISEVLPLDMALPAPGQGALGIQCRDDAPSLGLLEPINHALTQVAVTAERAFLARLGGGCAVPVAAYGEIRDGLLSLRGRVCAPDGSPQIDVSLSAALDVTHGGALAQARRVGGELADQALREGAAHILEAAP